jgi:hypothetical protein
LNDLIEGSKRRPLLAVAILAIAALAACSSTQDVLEPSAITPPDQGSATASTALGTALFGPSAAAGATAPSPAPSTQTAAIASNARIQFAPIVGTSVEAAASLSEQLANRARARGIGITGSTDTGATHLLKGYFTPLAEGRQTTIIYVWDVYDPSGNRVHRISGQQKAASSGGEGWSSVPPSAMQAVADSTIDQLATWLAGRGG